MLLFHLYVTKAEDPSLVLVMLVKDEAVHLQRTLPRWKSIIDFWVIGLDEDTSDDSASVIESSLSGTPGEIVKISFDGMGPSWSKVMKRAFELFPEASHGICADADFSPVMLQFDKSELDMGCSKQSFQVLSPERGDHRYIDWIYRNIEGAQMTKRVHQRLYVPATNLKCSRSTVKLFVEESSGGFQDRSGDKPERYRDWLLKDLEDDPNDAKTVFYIAQSYLDVFRSKPDDTSKSHRKQLEKAIEFFERRSEMEGDPDETYFAFLRLGQIYETMVSDGWDRAQSYYETCLQLDKEIGEAWFRMAQHYRMKEKKYSVALALMDKMAVLPVPRKNIVVWTYLYTCLGNLEYARVVFMSSDVYESDIGKAWYRLGETKPFCKGKHAQEIPWLEERLKEKKGKEFSVSESLELIRSFVKAHFSHMDFLQDTDDAVIDNFINMRDELFKSSATNCEELLECIDRISNFMLFNRALVEMHVPSPVLVFTEWDAMLSRAYQSCVPR